ncbi:amidase [Saccharopolyspora sp. WRP15-2]|uniref:Amidase n=1 Tax=Saccharopolyspora oryzae TaxID=2997343 RepID=A0ABT4V0B8_9PSEU|nr:amidase [Saccharopolyspora oryzae]MDA3627405.1 amidase [Saccharopolyspora oryzae]
MTGSRWQPWSLRSLVNSLNSGDITPAEAHQRARARIAETEPELRAWVELDQDVSPVADGPLGGVPLAVKDIIDLAGLPTRCGSQLRASAGAAEADATIVTAWRQAGAVPIGKSVTTEFAYFAPGPTRNPAALPHTPGGSSSGSAAAVGAGQVPLALGSQTAASVTRPAAFCGVASLVLSRGRFPVDGVTGLSPSLDSHGFFTASASDLALAWSALTGEPDAALTADRPPRLLLWPAAQFNVDPQMTTALSSACATLRAAGAVIDEFPDPQLITQLAEAHPVIMAYEAARERSAELAASSQISTQLATLLKTGAATPEHDYETARRTTTEAGTRVAELLSTYDAVLAPAALGPAPAGLDATGDPILSRPWQALGLPAAGIPAMRTPSGLPLGLQLIGTRESELLTTACWTESTLHP